MIRSPFELPEYALALERESSQRVIAFHDVLHRLAGFEVTPMTLRQYSLLRLVDSPFLPPFETPTPLQLIQFLWILNPRFSPVDSPEKAEFFARARKQFIPPPPPRWAARLLTTRWFFQRKTCEVREAAAIDAVRRFVEDMLADRPEASNVYSPSYYSDECSIVGTLSREYGWSAEQIMDKPLPQIFQHLNQIRETLFAEHGLPSLLSNPSDEIIQRHLAETNSQN